MKPNQFEPLGCPRCSGIVKVVMRKVRHPSGAILDVCDRCKGMWVDGPEVRMLYHHSIRTEPQVVGARKKTGAKKK